MPVVVETCRQAPLSERLRTVHSSFGTFSLNAMCPVLRTRWRGLRRCSFITTLGMDEPLVADGYFGEFNSREGAVRSVAMNGGRPPGALRGIA